jgi:integrase
MKRRSRPITFLLDTGARRGEIAGLRVIDIDFDVEVALVLGKGRRERALPFGRTDLMRLAGWKSRAMLQRYGASAADALAPARRIAASPPLIGSSSTPTGLRNLHACLTVAAFDVNTERHSRWVSGNRMGLTAQRH